MNENYKPVLNQLKSDPNCMDSYSSPVITVKPDSSLSETLIQMQTKFIKHVVVTITKKPLGIVTERDINKFLEHDKTSRTLEEIPIRELEKRNLITIAEGQIDHLQQCASRMVTFKVGSVIILDDKGDLVGITTKTDITKAYSQTYQGKYPVSNYMTRRVVTCRKSDSLKFALNTINSNNISRLVVTDNEGIPIGVITTNSFLKHTDYFEKPSKTSLNYLLGSENSQKLSVGDLLSKDLFTIRFDDDLANAAQIMIKNKIDGVPVLDKYKNLVGVITKDDIVSAFTQVVPHQKILEKYWQFH